MEIKYFGGSCFRVKIKDAYFLLGEATKNVEVDVVVGGENKKSVSPKTRKETFFINAPGEYEVGGIEVWAKGDSFWQIRANGWSFCYVTPGWKVPDEKKVDSLGQVDVLILTLPDGGKIVDDVKELIKRVSPLIVIPGTEDKTSDLSWAKTFLDAVDQEDLKPIDKLVIKHGNLPEETKFVLLEQKNG